jgi:glycosyltransferase involved in cell wall biosynthesis
MKALVIAPQPFFTPRGTPFSVYYRSLITSEEGVEIDLLTYGQGQDVRIPGVRIIRIPDFSFLGSVRVGPSFLKLFLDIFMTIWTVGLLLRHRYDFVHAHEEAVFICLFLKPLFGFKLIYDMHSSLPQQLRNFKFSKSNALIRVFKALEDASLKRAEAIVTICPDLYDYVNTIDGCEGKNFLIENSIFDRVRLATGEDGRGVCPPGDAVRGAAELLPAGKRCVVYTGTLEPYQGIDILLRGFQRVAAEVKDAFLVVVGGTPSQVNYYRGMARDLGLGDDCSFTGQVTQAEAKCYLGKAAVLVSPRSGGTNTPLKIYEYLSSGIPIVATKIYSHTQVLSEDVALIVDPVPEDIGRGILSALDPDGERDRLSANATRLYEEKYSRAVYRRKIKNLLGMVAGCAE